jgi:hypothetical protein
MTSSAPPPDITKIPQHLYEVLEVIYSSSNTYRALILRDDKGLMRVTCEMWNLSELEHLGTGYWGQVGKGATITDTIGSARILARERLREVGGDV